ncbi:Cof-type HAD-IIB family hydrolase [Carnobacterium funditum]|uniref:Cof-type HAD-IIB family hydrolase n=1 Tax=Carnobacterium funditum TaxID=2752 RepID=UPI00055137AF|nr:Cof-type HAD-IIB family hydrolase [Carnobacterium funditum]
MIKLIASDMDGTLLNEKMVISEINAKAILAAQENGVHFMVATGRGYTEAKPLLEEVGISCPIITLNGAQVYNEKGEVIENIGVSKKTVQTILEKINELGLYCEMTTSQGIYSDNKAKRIEAVASLIYKTNPDTTFKMSVVLAAARLEIMNINYVADYKELLDNDAVEILKIITFSEAGPKVLEPLAEKLGATGELAITASFVNNIEINDIKAQKGLALARAAEVLGIPTDDIMALGDNFNDVSMLKVAGYSVAVENAEDGVKAHAKYLTSANSENGVAQSILLALNDEMAKQLV